MSKRGRKENPAQKKARKQKQIAIGGAVLLVLLGAFEVPKLMKHGKLGRSRHDHGPPTSTTPADGSASDTGSASGPAGGRHCHPDFRRDPGGIDLPPRRVGPERLHRAAGLVQPVQEQGSVQAAAPPEGRIRYERHRHDRRVRDDRTALDLAAHRHRLVRTAGLDLSHACRDGAGRDDSRRYHSDPDRADRDEPALHEPAHDDAAAAAAAEADLRQDRGERGRRGRHDRRRLPQGAAALPPGLDQGRRRPRRDLSAARSRGRPQTVPLVQGKTLTLMNTADGMRYVLKLVSVAYVAGS